MLLAAAAAIAPGNWTRVADAPSHRQSGAMAPLGGGRVAYLGGSHRKRMIEAHGLREPPCNLGCCALSPPFNPYCCWFWCVPCAAAQEHKAMKRMLRHRAIDVTHDRL